MHRTPENLPSSSPAAARPAAEPFVRGLRQNRPMLLSRLAETRTALAATRSRNAKRDLIAEVLREASAEDVEIVVAYLSGGLRQRRTGVGWRTLQNPPQPAAVPSLTVAEVDQAFAEMAGLSGPGSAAARAEAVRALFSRATACLLYTSPSPRDRS